MSRLSRLCKKGDSGWSRAIFRQISSADSYDFSASADLPVVRSRLPMLKWLLASSSWYQVTEGLSSASFCRTFRADSMRLQRLGRLAALVQHDADVVVACARPLTNSVTEGLSSASF